MKLKGRNEYTSYFSETRLHGGLTVLIINAGSSS